MTEDCLFCKIIKGDVPSWKIYEDEKVYAFLDIFPVNIGHTLIIPKNHSKDLYEIPDEDLQAVALAAKKIAGALKKGLDADGINIMQNNEADAGQVVFHSHTHVIPRFKNDGRKHWAPIEFKEDEREEICDSIKNAL